MSRGIVFFCACGNLRQEPFPCEFCGADSVAPVATSFAVAAISSRPAEGATEPTRPAATTPFAGRDLSSSARPDVTATLCDPNDTTDGRGILHDEFGADISRWRRA